MPILTLSLLQFLAILTFPNLSSANSAMGQELLSQTVKFNFINSKIEFVLGKIEKQTSVKFAYKADLIPADTRITITADREPLSQVLDKLSESLHLNYEVVGKQIILTKTENKKTIRYKPIQARSELINEAQNADITITGKVTDAQGQELPGVSILIKNSSTGTTTQADGSYRIVVPQEGATLVFSYLGYTSVEKIVGALSVLNVVMTEDSKSLSEVVVVGYGTQKRASVTAAIASVPMEEIKDMPVSNVATALQGKIAGVVVQQNNGTPGSSPAIKVRGFGSISAGNSPLIVVDGNIVDPTIFGTLNPNDIESMDVLKDASSTAIYGSKGSNGVILITTKKGKNGKNQLSLDMYTGVQEVAKKLDLLDSQQFAEFGKEASNNAYLDNIVGANVTDPNSVRPTDYLRYRYPRGEVFDWLDFDDPTKVANLPNYDYQDLIFQKAKMSNIQLTASGGSDKGKYLISGGFLNQEGIIKRSDLKRYTFRANAELNLLPKLKIGMNLNPTFKVEQEVSDAGHWASNGIINAALSVLPMIPIYDEAGGYTSMAGFAAPYNYPGITNPVANITELNRQNTSINFLGNTYAQYDFLKHFTYRATANVNLKGNRVNSYRTSKMPLNQQLPPTVATGYANSYQTLSWLFNQTVNFNKTFNDVHEVDVLVGMESTRLQYEESLTGGSSYPNDVVETLNASANGSTTTGSSFKTANASASYFARINYNYNGKYLLNFSVRRDGSSIFGTENRWGTFPAASIGWRISEESFMKGISAISETKLRMSYGLAGNNAFNNYYPYVASLVYDNYSFGNTLVSGLAPGSLANNKLGWERSQQLDVGIDMGLFNNRIQVIVDYYKRTTKDLLLSVNVPTLTGFGSVVKNIGKMENKGWEFSLNTRNLVQEFTWSTGINLSLNRNKVLALGPNGDDIVSGSGIGQTNITRVGSPIGSFYGYKQLGVFVDQADLDANPHDATSRPGDVKYADINNDGKIDANDRTIIGNNQPDFIYGISNTLAYRGWDLGISIQGSQGNEVLNLSRRFFENLEGSANQITTVLDRWRSPQDPGDGITPRANARTTGNNNAVSTRWIEDASYLRIQNISLGYSLPESVLSKIKVSRVRIYGSAQNLFTFTKYLNYNPEVSNYEGPLTGGVDYGVFPLAKTFTIGLNLSL